MKTTVDIPDDELEDAMRFLGVKTKREAIVAALQELNRRHRMARLVRFSGVCDFPTNDQIEETVTAEAKADPR